MVCKPSATATNEVLFDWASALKKVDKKILEFYYF